MSFLTLYCFSVIVTTFATIGAGIVLTPWLSRVTLWQQMAIQMTAVFVGAAILTKLFY